MAEITKPNDLSVIWAASGERIKPANEKIQRGWVVEIPVFQNENWIQHRQDQAIAHINQHGIPVWDAFTQYLGGRSIVQGLDGKIYKANVDNVNTNPVEDNNVWSTAFLSPDDTSGFKAFNGYTLISSNFDVQVNTRYYAMTSVRLTLPATAKGGDGVIINKSPGSEVTLIVADGGQISTFAGLMDEVIFDIHDELNIVWNNTHWQTS